MTLPTFTYDPRGFELDDGSTIADIPDDNLRSVVEKALNIARSGNVDVHGVQTPVYWCGVLASWPWADLPDGPPDEDDVIEEVIKRAKVNKDGSLALTYAGTPWARSLGALARQEAREEADRNFREVLPDYGFGGNSEQLELHVIARGVFEIVASLLPAHDVIEMEPS